MIDRQIKTKIHSLVGKFPVISITGPRQSGKTTLVKEMFPNFNYVNFEDLSERNFAKQEGRAFLEARGKKLVIDEAQYVPEIFSYIQIFVDDDPERQYILTGSQNFLLMEKISQSLAGRVAIFYLLPFSLFELKDTNYKTDNYAEGIVKGSYPRIYDKNLVPVEWLMNYITTYVERDVRQLINIADLDKFQKFISLCAGRIGQLINFSSVANDLSVSYHTVQRWLSILETSFITFRIYPHFTNFNKRLVKVPKLYFYDTGLASALLGIRTSQQLQLHYLKGEMFENFILTELYKHYYNRGRIPQIYFWRDNKGTEIDCINTSGLSIQAIEIKSGSAVHPDFFKNLLIYQKLSGIADDQLFLINGGMDTYRRSQAMVVSWKDLDKIIPND